MKQKYISARARAPVAIKSGKTFVADVSNTNGAGQITSIIGALRNSWFLIAFIGGVIYWAARHDESLHDVAKIEARTTELESRMNATEMAGARMESKIDTVAEDVGIIKRAVLR